MNQLENITGLIMEYESGQLGPDGVLNLFSKLIESGMAWQLQGMYGRSAMAFIRAGYISEHGKILKRVETEDLQDE